MRIYQALYGERYGAHTLLNCSTLDPQEEVPFRDLIGLTDRFGSPPPGLAWLPYTSGYPFQEYYVLSKTFPDNSSREGMVLTHALLVPIDEMSACSVLSTVTSHLLARAERPSELPKLEIAIGSESLFPAMQNSDRQIMLAKALVHSDPRNLPVVWIGQDNFDQAIEKLWFNLWPHARRGMSFRLSFGPQDIEGHKVTVVSTPHLLANRWGSPYTTVNSGGIGETSVTGAEAFLLGLPEAEPLRVLQKQLSAILPRLSDIVLLERCNEGLLAALHRTNTDEARRMARLLGQLTPSNEQGAAIKQPVLNDLARLTSGGSASDILALRNFDFSPFPGGAELLDGSIQQWTKQAVRPGNRSAPSETAYLLKTAYGAPSAWGGMVRHGIETELQDWRRETATSVWSWWSSDQDLVVLLGNLLTKVPDVEDGLELACPKRISSELAMEVLALARAQSWYRLHAAILSASCSVEAAIRQHLSFDKQTSNEAALRVLANRVGADLFVGASIRINTDRLLGFSGKLIAEKPALRMLMDVSNAAWREVWLSSIKEGAPIFEREDTPTVLTFSLMDAINKGEEVSEELLSAVAGTKYADMTEYPERSSLWNHLPKNEAHHFLRATASGWIKSFWLRDDADLYVEPQLQEAIVGKPALWLNDPDLTPRAVIKIFRRFPDLNEQYFSQWLDAFFARRGILSAADATLIGEHVALCGWGSTATLLVHWFRKGQQSVLPAVRECASLLTLLDRLAFAFLTRNTVGEEEWWEAWIGISSDLYPGGLSDRNIWERAGGDLSRIEAKAPGQSQWRNALVMLKKGGGGKKISRISLLRQMREDFYANEHLTFLEKSMRS